VVVIGERRSDGVIWVRSWWATLSADEPFERRLLLYLAACVEAEAEASLRTVLGGIRTILLGHGEAPLSGATVVLDGDEVAGWARHRLAAGAAETVVAGWPVVMKGPWRDPPRDRPGPRAGTAEVAPLLHWQVRVRREPAEPGGHGERFVLDAIGGAVEVNPVALRWLGVERDAAERAVALADELPGSLSMAERAVRLVAALRDAGLVPDDVALDPRALGPLVPGAGLHNTAVVFVSEGDRAVYTRGLLEDLRALAARPPQELAQGPLGILLGRVPPPGDVAAEPLPVVVPTNAEQELAVALAMRSPFGVVTGPPGTGKTQVLVNVAAAAVVAGETVLLASKNNHAIDVVAERLRELPEAAAVRTGNRDHQAGAADAIATALARGSCPPGSLTEARRRWEERRRAAMPPYEQLAEIDRLRRELDEANRALAAHLAGLPPGLAAALGTPGAVDREILIASHQKAIRLLDELDETGRGWWARRRRRRLSAEADGQVRTTISLFDDDAQRELTEVLLREGPRAALARVADALVAHERRERVERARRQLDLSPSKEAAWAAIDADLVGREADGQDLLAAAWRERLRAASASDRAAADAYAQTVKAGSARSARRQMPATLACFPVWSVTSMSAAANFPLEAGLFDLVVIDEASQSDLASAIPLLYRAKRALVIGDPNQLTHICALSDEGDRRLAEGHGLDEDARAAFSYKATSLFAAAERAARRPPLLLRQHFRSHPDIIGFANREVYGGQLVVRTPASRLLRGKAFEWAHVEGPWERGPSDRSVRKPDEARAVLAELAAILAELGDREATVGIVSPFRAQVNLLRDLLDPELAGRVTIDTAHGFQGDERDVMILSPAVAPDLPEFTLRFAADPHVVNVAVTRARSGLVVVGDHRACLGMHNLLGALARYAVDLGAVRDARR
jgi:hypothetical protein